MVFNSEIAPTTIVAAELIVFQRLLPPWGLTFLVDKTEVRIRFALDLGLRVRCWALGVQLLAVKQIVLR